MSGQTNFEGHDGRECGEHRTTGQRAWCHSCTEWCYPDGPCKGCELPQLHAEVERLRGRTHEIQAQEMTKRAKLDSAIAEMRSRWDAARQWTEEVGLNADWAIDPTLPFWRMTSMATRDALTRLVAQRDDALAENERLRAAAAAVLHVITNHGEARRDDPEVAALSEALGGGA
jgi:hypothetical protein